MGISSDLIIAVKPKSSLNSITIDDFEQKKSLYDFIDKKFHDLIYSENDKVIDLEKIKKDYSLEKTPTITSILHKDSVMIVTLDDNLKISDPNIPFCDVTFNCIDFDVLHYLGGSSCYKKEIFDFYNKKESFKSLLTKDEFVNFYLFENSLISLEKYNELIYNKDSLIMIDLGY